MHCRPNATTVVSLLWRSQFYVQDCLAQRPTESFKELHQASAEALPLLPLGAWPYRWLGVE